MRGKLLFTVGVGVSVAVTAFGPRRGDAPALLLAATRGRPAPCPPEYARPAYPQPPPFDPRLFQGMVPQVPADRPVVRDLLLRYP